MNIRHRTGMATLRVPGFGGKATIRLVARNSAVGIRSRPPRYARRGVRDRASRSGECSAAGGAGRAGKLPGGR